MKGIKFTKESFDLDEYIRRLEFNKTEPEILSNLIKKAIHESQELQKVLKAMKSNASILEERLSRMGLLNSIEILANEKEKLASLPTISIDGSRQVVGGKGKRFYIMLSVAIVKLHQGIYGNFDVKYSDIDLIPFDDPTGDKIDSLAEDLMLFVETRALENVIQELRSLNQTDDQVIILDGPIVDPPRDQSDELRKLVKDNLDYIKYRCDVLKKAWKSGIKVYGYVKNIKTENFLKDLIATIDNLKDFVEVYASDEELAFSLFSLLYLRHEKTKNRVKQIVFFTEPQLAPSRIPIYQKYFQEDIKIYYSYSMPHLDGKVYRLEIATSKDADENEIRKSLIKGIKLITAMTLPGQQIPIPIYLAHEKCKIRKGAAEIIYREILAKGITIERMDDALEMIKYYIISK